MMSRLNAFRKALEIYKSQSAMANALGVDQTTISKRLISSKEVAAQWVLQIEKDTGVSRHDLRPDIYPRDIPKASNKTNVSGEWCDEYGNQQPILDKQLNGAVA